MAKMRVTLEIDLDYSPGLTAEDVRKHFIDFYEKATTEIEDPHGVGHDIATEVTVEEL